MTTKQASETNPPTDPASASLAPAGDDPGNLRCARCGEPYGQFQPDPLTAGQWVHDRCQAGVLATYGESRQFPLRSERPVAPDTLSGLPPPA